MLYNPFNLKDEIIKQNMIYFYHFLPVSLPHTPDNASDP